MKLNQIIIALPAVYLVFGSCMAIAKTINEAGALVCVTDKYTEKEMEKGHKLADWVGRCVGIPNSSSAEKYTEECVGKYEFKPDQSYKGSGSCTFSFKGSDDHLTDTWEEGSHLKANTWTYTGGTGKYKGATGGGTYTGDNLTDTLTGGKYKGKLQLP
jgi:hypothetical protein